MTGEPTTDVTRLMRTIVDGLLREPQLATMALLDLEHLVAECEAHLRGKKLEPMDREMLTILLPLVQRARKRVACPECRQSPAHHKMDCSRR